MSRKTLGQIAYEAFQVSAGRYPDWPIANGHAVAQMADWEAAGAAVAAQCARVIEENTITYNGEAGYRLTPRKGGDTSCLEYAKAIMTLTPAKSGVAAAGYARMKETATCLQKALDVSVAAQLLQAKEVIKIIAERDDLRARHAEALAALEAANGERDEALTELEQANAALEGIQDSLER